MPTPQRPRYPVIDAHNHLEVLSEGTPPAVDEVLARLDDAGVVGYVDLDGGWGEDVLHAHLDRFKAPAPDRFRVLGGVDWRAWPDHGDRFGEWAARRVAAQQRRGADGLKIWKVLGLSVRDQHDRLVAVDDPRLDPIWATAGALGLPVVIHVADPVAFFDPLDQHNERIDELTVHPEWHVPSPPGPSFRSIVDALARVVQRHTTTVFVGAHVGCYAENLDWVEDLIEQCPNFHVDIGARIAELGRQPDRARRFFTSCADRVLFGSDLGPDPASYGIAYRFLETSDAAFDYSTAPSPPQGRWRIHGLGLADDILRKVYHDNAARLFGFAAIPSHRSQIS